MTAPAERSADLVRGKLLFWVLVPCLIGLDLWSKSWAFEYVSVHGRGPNRIVEVVPGFFNLVRVTNEGTIFGIAQDWTSVLVGLRLIALFVLLFFLRGTSARAKVQILALALIFAGAVGNLYDNLFSPGRGVRDFLQFHVGVGYFRRSTWPIPASRWGPSCSCSRCSGAGPTPRGGSPRRP
jgi:signal peptidase II